MLRPRRLSVLWLHCPARRGLASLASGAPARRCKHRLGVNGAESGYIPSLPASIDRKEGKAMYIGGGVLALIIIILLLIWIF
jgi:hypothetical protein